MANVVWPSAAIDHIDQITAYIAQFDSIAAEEIRARLLSSGNSLIDFPNRGRHASGGTGN
jgi:plasmid stabilization system protein ParE